MFYLLRTVASESYVYMFYLLHAVASESYVYMFYLLHAVASEVYAISVCVYNVYIVYMLYLLHVVVSESYVYKCTYSIYYTQWPVRVSMCMLYVLLYVVASDGQLSEARLMIERNVMSHIYTHAMFPNGDGDIMRDKWD